MWEVHLWISGKIYPLENNLFLFLFHFSFLKYWKNLVWSTSDARERDFELELVTYEKRQLQLSPAPENDEAKVWERIPESNFLESLSSKVKIGV